MNKNGIIGMRAKMMLQAINFLPIVWPGLLLSWIIKPIITAPNISQQLIKKYVIDISVPSYLLIQSQNAASSS